MTNHPQRCFAARQARTRKAQAMCDALAKLAREYQAEGRGHDADQAIEVVRTLTVESAARLYDLIREATS